jgi:PAS domain S-box-containing protein
MKKIQLTTIFLDQSKDSLWMVNLDFQLIYANKTFMNVLQTITGKEQKLYDTIFRKDFSEKEIEEWKTYYNRAFHGEYFETENHYYDSDLKETQYGQTTFEPLKDDDNNIFAVSCRWKNVTNFIKNRKEENQLIDASLDVFCTINKENLFVYVSAAASLHWGYLPEELIGTKYQDLILEEDINKSTNEHASILQGNDTKSFFNRYKKKDGSIAYNLWSVRWDNETNLMYCVARDVKEKYEQEEKIKLNEQRFRALVQEGSDLISILDKDGNYIYASPNSNTLIGIIPNKNTIKNIFEFIHPDDAQNVRDNLQKVITEKKVIVAPFRFQNHKKEWRWIESVLTNMLENPAVNGIVANSRDITDKIEEKQILKLLESVVINTNDAILITEAEPFDKPGPKIIYVNEAFTKMTGYKAEEVLGKTPRILQGPNSDKEELAKLSKALRNWKPCEITTINYKKNGEEFWINFSVLPVADERGRYTHWIAIERDVTQQKNKEFEKELVNNISDAFHKSNDLKDCLTNLCEHITEFGDFDFAEMWLPSVDSKTINLVTNYIESKVGKTFYNKAKKHKFFLSGEAIPGYVWENEATEIWDHQDELWNIFKRKLAAKKSGIKAIMGVPLKHNGDVIGVLLLGTEKTKATLTLHLDLFQRLESIIGNELSRKKTEIELEQIFNFTPDMICVAGFDGYIKRINPAGLELLGYSLKEIQSRPIASFIYKDDQPLTTKFQKELYKGENLRNIENRYVTKDGEIVWLNWTATSLPEQGIVYAVAKNITEEKKLRELNRQVGEFAKIGSWEVNLVNETIFWTDEVHRLHETDPNLFVPSFEEAINFYRADFHEMVRVNVENCVSTGKPYYIEAILVTANNKEVWVSSTGNGEFVDGVCTRIYGSIQNIDERKQAEIRLQLIANNLPGIAYQYQINPDGTNSIKKVSGKVEEILEFTVSEVLNNNKLLWKQIKKGGDLDDVTASINKSIETKSKWTSQFKYVMPKSGKIHTYLGYGMPSFLADGSIIFNSILLDVTKEARTEELLKQAGKLARIGSWEVDLINETVFWSDEVHKMYGTDPKLFTPNIEAAIDFYKEDFREIAQSNFENCITSREPYTIEAVIITNDKKELWVRTTGKAEYVDNVCIRVHGSFQDINEQKLATIKLEKSLKELKDYKFSLDQSAIIASTDNKGVITSVNDNFCKISKYKREELIGKTHQIINAKYHTKEFFNNLWKKISAGNVWRGEIKNKTKDNYYYWVDTTIVPFLDEENKPSQYLAIRFDITERKDAEIKLAESENKFRTILEAEPECVKLLAPDGKLLMMNQAGLSMVEAENKEQVIGKSILGVLLPKHKASFSNLIKGVFKGKSSKLEYEIKGLKGTHRWLETHSVPMRNDQGDITSLLGITRDITDRKKATEEKNNLQQTLENSLNEIYIFDKETLQFTYANKGACLNLGYSKEEIKSLTPIDIKPEFTAKSFEKLVTSLVTHKKEKIVFFTNHKRKDQSLYPVEIHLQLITEDNHKRFLAIILDITERKKAEEMYRLLADHTNDLICMHEPDSSITYISPSIKNLLGFTQSELLDKQVFELIHKEDLQPLKNVIKDGIFKGFDLDAFTYRARHKKGYYVWLESLGSPIIKNDKIVSFITSTRNVTQWMLAKQEIQEYQSSLQKLTAEVSLTEEKQKKQIAANIHDHLSQSLVISKMRISDLEKKTKLKDVSEDLGFIKSHISKALENSRKITYELSPPVLYQLGIVDALDWFAEDIQEKYGFEFKFNSNVDALKIDEFKSILIFRCVQETVTNAIKHAKATLMSIEFIKDEKGVTIFIKDNGTGFDTKKLKQVNTSGSGFGLFAVQERIRNMKGSFSISSKINAGTVVKIYVPL